MQPFLQSFVDSAVPVLKICLLGSVGALLAAQGVLDGQGRRSLSRLQYLLFTPCLTFSKLAPVLSAGRLVAWLPLMVNMLVSVGVGLLLGLLLQHLLRPPPWFRRQLLAATALGNAGNLPLVLVAALLREKHGRLPGSGSSAVSEDTAIAYVALGIAAATITHFTIGTTLLAPQRGGSGSADSGGGDGTKRHGGSGGEEGLPLVTPQQEQQGGWHKQQQQQQQQPGAGGVELQQQRGAAADRARAAEADGAQRLGAATPPPPGKQQRAGVYVVHASSSSSSSDGGGGDMQATGGERTRGCSSSSQAAQLARRAGAAVASAAAAAAASAWELCSPPLCACLLAVLVGLLPPLQAQLFGLSGRLRMLQDCIAMFGDCCIPALMLNMGAALAQGPGRCSPPTRLVVGVAAARLLVLPALGAGWLLAARAAGWLPALPDPAFVLVMLLQNAVPTALNVHTLATMYRSRDAEVGATLFWQYLASCVTLPAALMAFGRLLEAGAFGRWE